LHFARPQIGVLKINQLVCGAPGEIFVTVHLATRSPNAVAKYFKQNEAVLLNQLYACKNYHLLTVANNCLD